MSRKKVKFLIMAAVGAFHQDQTETSILPESKTSILSPDFCRVRVKPSLFPRNNLLNRWEIAASPVSKALLRSKMTAGMLRCV